MSRLDKLSLEPDERAELYAKVQEAFTTVQISSLVVVGSQNIAYLTGGVVFPYLDQQMIHPVALHINFSRGTSTIVCTADVSEVPSDCGWNGSIKCYDLAGTSPEESLSRALVAVIQHDSNEAAAIGFDSVHVNGALHRHLHDGLPGHTLQPIDDLLTSLRIIKTPAEVRMLEIAARIGDRGYISALNHAEGAALDRLSFPMWEFGERFRVHVGEFEGSGVGNLAVMQGHRARDLHHRTGTREIFEDRSYLRIEYSMSNRGYWIAGSRTAYVGQAGPSAKRRYADNIALRAAALRSLTAGSRASDVFEAVRTASLELNIPFWQQAEIGHGVGTSEREAPFLAPYDSTVLQPNMVVALGIYTYGEDGELICNRDIYRVTEGGAELLSWYKNWDRIYSIHGTSARHG